MNIDAASLREPLTNICQRFRVERIYLFGSAADGRFDSERSDLDFLVVFGTRQLLYDRRDEKAIA